MEVIRNQVIEPLLFVGRDELLHQRVAIRVLHVLQRLTAQGAFAEGLEALLQLGEVDVVSQAREARSKALEVAERVLVHDADQTVELQQGILERRRREQHLRERRDGLLDREGDLARCLVDVPQAVRFVDDD